MVDLDLLVKHLVCFLVVLDLALASSLYAFNRENTEQLYAAVAVVPSSAKNSPLMKSSHELTPTPSSQLQLHMFVYKPENFVIYAEKSGIARTTIGFTYPSTDQTYDRYIFRVRFHGHEEYATNKLKINRTAPNQLVLKNFIDAPYTSCVTLFSSSGLPEYPPLSTSDMCVDFTVGDAHKIGGSHSSTGLLSPLLFAVVAVLLALITIEFYAHRALRERRQKAKERKAELTRSSVTTPSMDLVAMKETLDDSLSQASTTMDIPKWQAAVHKCKIVENKSEVHLDAMDSSEYEAAVEAEIQANYVNALRKFSQMSTEITSIQTLAHLLNNKPWRSTAQTPGSRRRSRAMEPRQGSITRYYYEDEECYDNPVFF